MASSLSSPDLGKYKGAFSMEGVAFVIVGGDVGSSQEGAGGWTIFLLTAPLAQGTGTTEK